MIKPAKVENVIEKPLTEIERKIANLGVIEALYLEVREARVLEDRRKTANLGNPGPLETATMTWHQLLFGFNQRVST